MDSGIKKVFDRIEESNYLDTGLSLDEILFQTFMLGESWLNTGRGGKSLVTVLAYHNDVQSSSAISDLKSQVDLSEVKSVGSSIERGSRLPSKLSSDGKVRRGYHSITTDADTWLDVLFGMLQNGLSPQGMSSGQVGDHVFAQIQERYNDTMPWVVFDVTIQEMTRKGYDEGDVFTVSDVNPDRIVGVNGFPVDVARNYMDDMSGVFQDLIQFHRQLHG